MIERQLVGDRLCDPEKEQQTPRRFRGAIKNSRVVPVGERRKQTSRRAASLPICLMIPHFQDLVHVLPAAPPALYLADRLMFRAYATAELVPHIIRNWSICHGMVTFS